MGESLSEAKRTRRGCRGGSAPCIIKFVEFAFKIGVFDRTFPILSERIEFLAPFPTYKSLSGYQLIELREGGETC